MGRGEGVGWRGRGGGVLSDLSVWEFIDVVNDIWHVIHDVVQEVIVVLNDVRMSLTTTFRSVSSLGSSVAFMTVFFLPLFLGLLTLQLGGASSRTLEFYLRILSGLLSISSVTLVASLTPP